MSLANFPNKRKSSDAAPVQDKLLSIDSAAALLGLSPRALYHRVARRSVPFRKLGRKVVFSERDLLAFINDLPSFEPLEK